MPDAAQSPVNLLDLDPAGLAACIEAAGEKPFRARQVSRWVHQRYAADFDAMTDLSKGARATLAACTMVAGPAVIRDSVA
ncbi:MAG TPA: 23S rRNA (adenine(2503)-C(2))-methyltransferase RlmN, partial [Casimicrobiaceae bacterium]